MNTDVLKLNGKVSALQNQKETIEDRINEVKDLESQSRLFDFYLNALSKDPLWLADNSAIIYGEFLVDMRELLIISDIF